MSHSIRQREASGKGLVATTRGFQKTGAVIIRLHDKKLLIFRKLSHELRKLG